MMTLRIVFLLTLIAFTLSAPQFSGFYRPHSERGVNGSGSEDFAAAWLVTKTRLNIALQSLRPTEKYSMASATFAVVRNNCTGCLSLMTRDYFDYMVEHMSSTSNRIPHGSKEIYNLTSIRVQSTVNELKVLPSRCSEDRRSQLTLGVLVFSTRAFSAVTTKEQANIRIDYFQATFYSVYRYFCQIAVFVATEADAEIVQAMKIPYKYLVIIPVVKDTKDRNPSLVTKALVHLIENSNNNEWSWFKYVYFTEGDQVVHMRTIKEVFDMIDASNGGAALVPHRMQTYPLRTTYPKNVQKMFDTQKKSGQHNLPHNLELIVEDLEQLKGSCCDSGRYTYEVSKQGGWWYTYNEWGLANFTQWFRVGKTGLTFIPSTEHKGVCAYSVERKVCDLPPGCKERIPLERKKKATSKSPISPFPPLDFLCRQIPTVRHIVNYTAQMEREREYRLSRGISI